MKIFGVKIDQVNIDQTVNQVCTWVKQGGKHYIVTPNIEFVMAAQNNPKFRESLNQADLAIPDSNRLGWAATIENTKNPFKKLLLWPFFLWPKFPLLIQFDVVTGTDLMTKLIERANNQGFTIGLLGAAEGVALKLKERLLKKYPSLKITFADSGGQVQIGGNQNTKYKIPNTDLLFVAFGHIKQEAWMAKNLKASNVKVMMGVGGAFDYLSGNVPRAPIWLRQLGLEWLFRGIVQPWRITRFINLIKFVFLVLT